MHDSPLGVNSRPIHAGTTVSTAQHPDEQEAAPWPGNPGWDPVGQDRPDCVERLPVENGRPGAFRNDFALEAAIAHEIGVEEDLLERHLRPGCGPARSGHALAIPV